MLLLKLKCYYRGVLHKNFCQRKTLYLKFFFPMVLFNGTIILARVFSPVNVLCNTALLWQKEASDIPSKLSYWCFHNSHNELFFQAKFHAETLILLRDVIMIFHWCQCKWQTHFALLREMSLLSLASFCKLGQNSPQQSTNLSVQCK